MQSVFLLEKKSDKTFSKDISAASSLPVKNNYLEMAMLAQTDSTMKTVA